MTRISDVMSRAVWAVAPDTPVIEAVEFARRHQIQHLPVLENARVVGLVCTCDLDEAKLGASVSSVMHARPASIQADLPIEAAAERMEEDAIGSLIVLSGDVVVGLLTKSDVARFCGSEEMSHCAACGSFQHLKPARPGELVLCADCSARSRPPVDERELGTGD